MGEAVFGISGLLRWLLKPLGHALLMTHQLIAGAFVGLAAVKVPQLAQLGVEGVVDGVVLVQGTSPGGDDLQILTESKDGGGRHSIT